MWPAGIYLRPPPGQLYFSEVWGLVVEGPLNWPPFRPGTSACPRRLWAIPKHVLMSEIEIITDGGRRLRWSAAEKLRIVEETLYDGESISAVARRNGVAPNLLYRWRRLMLEGGGIAVTVRQCNPQQGRPRDGNPHSGTRTPAWPQDAGGGGGDPEVGARQVTVKKPTLRVRSLKPDGSQ